MAHRELPTVRRQNYRAHVIFDNVTEPRPTSIFMRPSLRAGNNYDNPAILRYFGELFKREVHRVLRNYLPTWTLGQRRAVTGELFMRNWNNEGQAANQRISVAQLNGNLFLEMFEQASAAGSNPDLNIYDVDWLFYIDPNSLQRGGMSATFKNVKKLRGILNWDSRLKTTKELSHKDVGCLALALARGMQKVLREEKYLKNKNHSLFASDLFTQYCYDLQKRACLDKLSTIQDVEKFTSVYQEWRVCIITNMYENPEIYTGCSYTPNSDHKQDKTIFIYLDGPSEHFVAVTGIVELAASLKGVKHNNIKMCYICCTCYPTNSESSCKCKESSGVKQVRKMVTCDCGEKYQKGSKHRCGQKSCHFCQQFYKDQSSHRCPIYIKPSTLERVFKGDENPFFEHPENSPQPEAWVWDIESHFVVVPAGVDEYGTELYEETDSYKVDEDGFFEIKEGCVQVSRVAKLAQLPNYVFCKNVFTGEERTFTDIESFIRFAVAEQNDGYNYMYAHNSSGYDSRLVYEAAEKMLIHPPEAIMRGSRFMKLKFGI